MDILYNNFDNTYKLLKNKLSWDYIDILNISVESLEEFFKNMNLNVVGRDRSPYVEDKLNPPSMVCYFYYYLYLYKRIPNQEEYINFYYLLNSEWVKNHVGKQYNSAFQGRLSRFYPSMLRDIHFYHLLKESKLFKRVLFVLEYDLDAKVDIFIESSSQWYGIQLRTNTRNSHKYYKKKNNRNMISVKATLIDIPINLNSAKYLSTKGNDIKLYSNIHIRKILNKINKLENT